MDSEEDEFEASKEHISQDVQAHVDSCALSTQKNEGINSALKKAITLDCDSLIF